MLIDAQIGGLGLQHDETLIRFGGTAGWSTDLLCGRLSLTQVRKFWEEDHREGRRTEADETRMREFFGGLADYQVGRMEKRAQFMCANAYANCWHRFSRSDSDLDRVLRKFTAPGFKIAVTTTVSALCLALKTETESADFCELLAVMYLEENEHMEDVLNHQMPSLYPELNFKRKRGFDYEREARVVLHSARAATFFQDYEMHAAMAGPERKFIRVDPTVLISGIFLIDGTTDERLETQIESIGLASRVHKISSREFLDYFSGQSGSLTGKR